MLTGMKNLVFLRSYFLFKEKLVAHENIQLFRPPSERSQVSGGFKVWAFFKPETRVLFWMKLFDSEENVSVASCFCRPSVPTTGVNLQYDFLQLQRAQETTDAELIWQLWIQIKNLIKIFFLGGGFLLLNSLETDDMTRPHLDVKLTCGNTFIAAYLIEILMKYFLTRLRRNHQLSSDDSLVTADITSWCISG